MTNEDVKFISKLLISELYSRLIFLDLKEDGEVSSYDRKLFKMYCTLSTCDPNEEVQLSSSKTPLLPTPLDETIVDRLIMEEFYINTGRVGILFLQAFEDAVVIDKVFFNSVRSNMKELSLDFDDIDQKRLINILNNVESYTLSEKWRVQFTDQLFDRKDILKILLYPSLFLIPTLVKLWVNY
jgi:hypothetical protein